MSCERNTVRCDGPDSKVPGRRCIVCSNTKIESLELQVDELKAILKAVEWVHDPETRMYWCPYCEEQREKGHAEGCALGHALHGAFPPGTVKRVQVPPDFRPGCICSSAFGGPCPVHTDPNTPGVKS
jgi:hypothetical protein